MKVTIWKGWHYCNILFSRILHVRLFKALSTVKFEIILSDSMWYSTKELGDFTNKLCGFSYGHPHKNSIRIGWRPSDEVGKIDLFYYSYNNGKRVITPFITINTGSRYRFIMNVMDTAVEFICEDNGDYKFKKFPFIKPESCLYSTILYPYFGGNPTAPNEMKLKFKVLHKFY